MKIDADEKALLEFVERSGRDGHRRESLDVGDQSALGHGDEPFIHSLPCVAVHVSQSLQERRAPVRGARLGASLSSPAL